MAEEDRLVMVPGDLAARIAGISRQRLYYWEHTNLITPTYRKRLSQRSIVRLYDLQRLTELKVAVQLIDGHGVTTQSMRPLLKFLRVRYAAPLATLRYGVQNRKVFWNPGSGWSSGANPSQPMLEGTLQLQEIRTSVRRALRYERTAEQAGRVVKVRGVQGSAPVFDGTRIPLVAVWEFLEDEESASAILSAYPELTARDIAKAKRMREAAKLLKAGVSIEDIAHRFSELSEDEIRSIKQLKHAA